MNGNHNQIKSEKFRQLLIDIQIYGNYENHHDGLIDIKRERCSSERLTSHREMQQLRDGYHGEREREREIERERESNIESCS